MRKIKFCGTDALGTNFGNTQLCVYCVFSREFEFATLREDYRVTNRSITKFTVLGSFSKTKKSLLGVGTLLVSAKVYPT